MITLILIALIAVLMVLFCWPREPSGRERSLDFNARYGRYRVLYPDGRRSQPLCKDVAEEYAELFKGTVIPADEPTETAARTEAE